jgi:predicted DsbA family dithiol-disulfide isomerase
MPTTACSLPHSLALLLSSFGASRLDQRAFEDCLKGTWSVRVRVDRGTAAAMGISSTPFFLVGRLLADGRVEVRTSIVGAIPVNRFRKVLDQVLEK